MIEILRNQIETGSILDRRMASGDAKPLEMRGFTSLSIERSDSECVVIAVKHASKARIAINYAGLMMLFAIGGYSMNLSILKFAAFFSLVGLWQAFIYVKFYSAPTQDDIVDYLCSRKPRDVRLSSTILVIGALLIVATLCVSVYLVWYFSPR